jgi:uncharacterized phage-associated protein
VTASIDVTRCLIQLAAQEEEPELLTHMRVQKLAYYAQGWSLALLGRPLFSDPIEAWTHGPVACDLYQRLKRFDNRALQLEELGPGTELDSVQKEIVRAVWGAYRLYSAAGLREKTHREPPWKDARNGYGDNDHCNVEITHEAMRTYFAKCAEVNAEPGLDPRRAFEAAGAIEEGRGASHEEVFARLRGRACPTD